MKFIETSYGVRPVQESNGSSYIVYITKDREQAMSLHMLLLSLKSIHPTSDWCWHVSTVYDIGTDCRIPEFFHNGDYQFTMVEHNNGDWDKPATYKLYIVE